MYHDQDLSLVPEAMLDEAMKIEEIEAKREKKMQAQRGQAPRAR